MDVKILLKIKELEGGVLHKNAKEKDITTGYGIYKSVHPDEPIFEYIEKVAKDIGIDKPSPEYTKEDCAKIEKAMDEEEEIRLTDIFYTKYFGTNMDFLLPKLQLIYKLTFINSVKIANESLQELVNYCIDNLESCKDVPRLKVDGILGSASRAAIKQVQDIVKDDRDLTEFFFIIAVGEYIELVDRNRDKYGLYLKGWYNRLRSCMKGV